MNNFEDDFFPIEMKSLGALSALAKKFKTTKGVESQFASVVINANIADYILDVLIEMFSFKISELSKNSPIHFLEINVKGKQNRQKRECLDYFEFKNKTKIKDLLGKIQTCRDHVFHNLVKADRKKINVTQDINNIQKYTDELRLLVADTLQDI